MLEQIDECRLVLVTAPALFHLIHIRHALRPERAFPILLQAEDQQRDAPEQASAQCWIAMVSARPETLGIVAPVIAARVGAISAGVAGWV